MDEKAIQGEIDTAYRYQQLVYLLDYPKPQKLYEEILLSNPDFKIFGLAAGITFGIG